MSKSAQKNGKPVAGDLVVFGSMGHILVRPGKRYYRFFVTDGNDTVAVALPIGQAIALCHALDESILNNLAGLGK